MQPTSKAKAATTSLPELDTAIHTHRTWVSKGALLLTEVLPETNELLLTFTDAHKTGFAVPKNSSGRLKGKDKTFTTGVSLDKPVRVSLNQLSGTDPIIPLLYEAPGINGAATVSNAAHVAASTSCGSAADASSAAGQLKANRRASCNRRTALRQPGSLQGLRNSLENSF